MITPIILDNNNDKQLLFETYFDNYFHYMFGISSITDDILIIDDEQELTTDGLQIKFTSI
jgi:hypothetical protein